MNDDILEKLSRYKMTMDELNEWENFCSIVRKKCDIMGIPKDFDYIIEEYYLLPYKYYAWNKGFSEEYGYYWLSFGDRGELNLRANSKTLEDFLWCILEGIASSIGSKLELQNRSEYMKLWRYSDSDRVENKENWVYNLRYDFRKFWFTYSIRCLSKIYHDERLDEYIKDRTGYMNRWFYEPHWGFDKEKMDFIEISDSPEHD